MNPIRIARTVLLAFAAAALLGTAGAQAPEPIPAKTFLRHPDIGAARLSPSGRWLAIATASASSRVLLAVIDLQGSAKPSVVARFTDADIRTFEWVNDDRLVFSITDLQPIAEREGFFPGLYSVRRDGSEVRQLVRVRRAFMRERTQAGQPPLEYNHELLSVPRTGGDDVIVGEYQFDGYGNPRQVIPKRLNVVTGRASPLLFGMPEHVTGWLFDPKGEPRVAEATFQGQTEVLWRAAGQDGWRSLDKFPSTSARLEPVLVDGAGALFVTTPSITGTAELKRFDFAANRPEEQAIVRAPGFDFEGGLITADGVDARVIGVRVETDAESTVWFDDSMKKLQALADGRFPGRINRITCRRCSSDGVLLVFSYSDQDPGSYWLYRASSQAWESVGKVRSDVDPKAMAQLDLHRIRARDGQDLPVWVTKPPGKASGPLPAVVLVHGGPWVRGGRWHWSGEAQFLASRGYVVIEPEFRGSTGFGRSHFESGFKKWGTTMQDDVADAALWAGSTGLVDAKRVCIAGASYGGYATLMGLIRFPDLYKCGVAWVAVTDPRLLFEESWQSDMSKEGREYSLPVMLGDLRQDADMLKAAAPVELATKIRAPLLMAFGRDDRRVPIEHGTRMRDAMKAAGRDPEWIVYEGEGHGWRNADNEIDFWGRVERFLGKQLK